MKKILLPLTLYANYENLLAYAIQLVSKSQAELHFLYTSSMRSSKLEAATFPNGQELSQKVRSKKLRTKISQMFDNLDKDGITYSCMYGSGSSYSGIIKECNTHTYDLVLLPSHGSGTLLGYVHDAWLHKIIEQVQTPVFIVPKEGNVNDIRHITYAIDLREYDPVIIQKIKNLAAMLDAKLSLVHVNSEESQDNHDSYLTSLEKTISDTLDYPKVQYNFFDHQDILGGINKTIKLNNSQLIAMTNRKQFSWRDLIRGKSFTQRMAKRSNVPLLAFSKYNS